MKKSDQEWYQMLLSDKKLRKAWLDHEAEQEKKLQETVDNTFEGKNEDDN